MEHNIIKVNYEGVPVYDIRIEDNYDNLYKALEALNPSQIKICIVTDSNVGPLYLEQVTKIMKEYSGIVTSYTFPAGEENKNLDTVKKLYEYLIQCEFDRNDILVALGGGVVGDLTGFAAATYLRGIRFVQMPTSLLSMVDSSIGGKTGVDFDAYKNMVGAFHQPELVYINLSVLESLDNRQFASGMAEIIKHSLIKDKDYYQWLIQQRESILSKDVQALSEMIYRSCIIKKNVVETDPTEKGERALLNFGHTIGHAVEKCMDFKMLHGECVGIGIAAANYIACQRNLITRQESEQVLELLQGFHLAAAVSGVKLIDIIKTARHDKKMDSGKIKFILLNRIGEAIIDKTVSEEEMEEAVLSIIC